MHHSCHYVGIAIYHSHIVIYHSHMRASQVFTTFEDGTQWVSSESPPSSQLNVSSPSSLDHTEDIG